MIPYNKEHCLPRYFLKSSNYSYDNNMLLQVPIDMTLNELRSNKPYFCPSETETNPC